VCGGGGGHSGGGRRVWQVRGSLHEYGFVETGGLRFTCWPAGVAEVCHWLVAPGPPAAAPTGACRQPADDPGAALRNCCSRVVQALHIPLQAAAPSTPRRHRHTMDALYGARPGLIARFPYCTSPRCVRGDVSVPLEKEC
jgi:hypothetical protein